MKTARLQALFTYKLHPDDHAAALAYCQALDLNRGQRPTAALTYLKPNEIPVQPTPAEIEEQRKQIFHQLRTVEPDAYIPKL